MITINFYGAKCQMCGDNPNVTCTCNRSNNSYTQTITEEQIPEIKKKKKRMPRIQKQAMYGR